MKINLLSISVFFFISLNLSSQAQNQNKGDYLLNDAIKYHKSADYKSADALFKKIIALKSIPSSEFWLWYGINESKQNKHIQANTYIKKYLESNPNDTTNITKAMNVIAKNSFDNCKVCFGKAWHKVKYNCNVCKGEKAVKDTCKVCRYGKKITCLRCKGEGVLKSIGTLQTITYKTCGACEGVGVMNCTNCKGDGYLEKKCHSCNQTGFIEELKLCFH